MTTQELRGFLAVTFKAVLAGKLETGVGNCLANIARAIVAVNEHGELDERLSRLEEAIAPSERKQA
jgi:hypothetical protein